MAISETFSRHHPLTSKAKKLLHYVNYLLAEKDIPAAMQSERFTRKLIQLVHEQQSKADFKKSGREIEVALQQILSQDSARSAHAGAGRFDETRLHERALRDEMQDHDMTRFMPRSHGHIEVLAVINQMDRASIAVVEEGIRLALADASKQHICFAMGPGHWRGVYITKPQKAGAPFQVELFDPYGPHGALAIETRVRAILQSSGLAADRLVIKRSGPPIPQADGYACGDFTCAYSHRKMRDFGAPKEHYNDALIKVLEKAGNQENILRETTRALSAGRAIPEAKLERLFMKSKHKLVEKPATALPVVQTKPVTHPFQGFYKTTPEEVKAPMYLSAIPNLEPEPCLEESSDRDTLLTLSGFNDCLEEFRLETFKLSLNLQVKKEATKVYGQLYREKTKFISSPEMTVEEFSEQCQLILKEASKTSLSQHQGFNKIMSGLLQGLVGLVNIVIYLVNVLGFRYQFIDSNDLMPTEPMYKLHHIRQCLFSAVNKENEEQATDVLMASSPILI